MSHRSTADAFFPSSPLAHADDDAPPRIVVLGGGYAGVLAANRLAGRLGHRARITLVEERDELVHRVRLHEVIAHGPGKTYPLDAMVHRGVRRVRRRAARVDAASRHVEMRDGVREPFDHLIIAVGSAPRDAIPGALAHAGALAGPEAALAAYWKLAALRARDRVVVIGGGLSGVEVAAEIAERHRHLEVTLLAGTILPGVSDGGRRYAESVIADLGIARRRGEAVAIDARGVDLADGERLDASLVIWAGGFAACGAAIESDLRRDGDGRLLVDESLRAAGHDRIWIAGDAAAPPPGLSFARMSCALAMPMGAHAADNVVRALRGRAPERFRFGYTGQCISLGRARGLVQMVSPNDRARPRFFSGTMAAVVKEVICTFVTGALRVERAFAGAYLWPRTIAANGELIGEANAEAGDEAPALAPAAAVAPLAGA